MLATEMTDFLNPEKTIIISSAKCRKELPQSFGRGKPGRRFEEYHPDQSPSYGDRFTQRSGFSP